MEWSIMRRVTATWMATPFSNPPSHGTGRLLSVDGIRTLPDQPVAPSSWCYAQKKNRAPCCMILVAVVAVGEL
jgi:hypothetical protein